MMRPHHCQVSNQLCLVISILLWILAPRGLAIYPSYPKLYLGTLRIIQIDLPLQLQTALQLWLGVSLCRV